MYYVATVIVYLAVGCWSAPVDEPIRVDLPVYDQPQSASDVQLAQPLQPENHPSAGARSDNSLVGNLISHKIQAATSALGSKLSHVHQGGIFSAPVKMREEALLETEGWGSKTLSIKENIHNIVAGIFQPKAIVDSIKEEDKYGNNGDKFYAAGRALVGGAEGVSNLVNTVLEVPGSIIRKITRAATEKLNNLGGRLIGLN